MCINLTANYRIMLSMSEEIDVSLSNNYIIEFRGGNVVNNNDYIYMISITTNMYSVCNHENKIH
jgi:hypothetical protein